MVLPCGMHCELQGRFNSLFMKSGKLLPSLKLTRRIEDEATGPALTVHGLRAKRGWRLYDLANVSGVSMSTAASVEKGGFRRYVGSMI
jgi:hypothetical protein